MATSKPSSSFRRMLAPSRLARSGADAASDPESDPSADRAPITLRTAVLDASLAALVGLGVAFSAPDTPGPAAAEVLGALIGAALFVRRLRPLTAWAVVLAASAVYVVLGGHPVPVAIAAGVALPAVSRRTGWWGALISGTAAIVVVLVPYLIRVLGTPSGRDQVWGVSALIGVVLLLPAILPAAVRTRRRAVRRARLEEVGRRVAEERLSIAREVHDVVGHALAVISMQSGIAVHVSGKRPEQVVDSIEALSRVSRDALAELDRTFGVFRETPAGADPALDQLDALAATMRRAGVEVDLTVRGERVPLLPEVERAAYRIVQESLTNVLHHADTDRASVELAYETDALLVRVANAGAAAAGGARPREASGRKGHGIQGMRDRTEALGGVLEAGPDACGGFLVVARLPRAG